MKKQIACTVMVMSMALVMAGCGNKSTVSTQEPVTQQEVVKSYNNEIELGVGETLTFDKLNIVADGDIAFNFTEKAYDKVGTYDEVITYNNDKLVVKVKVVDKTAPVISETNDIEVAENTEGDISEDMTSDEEESKVSDYDTSSSDTSQTVTSTATDVAVEDSIPEDTSDNGGSSEEQDSSEDTSDNGGSSEEQDSSSEEQDSDSSPEEAPPATGFDWSKITKDEYKPKTDEEKEQEEISWDVWCDQYGNAISEKAWRALLQSYNLDPDTVLASDWQYLIREYFPENNISLERGIEGIRNGHYKVEHIPQDFD